MDKVTFTIPSANFGKGIRISKERRQGIRFINLFNTNDRNVAKVEMLATPQMIEKCKKELTTDNRRANSPHNCRANSPHNCREIVPYNRRPNSPLNGRRTYEEPKLSKEREEQLRNKLWDFAQSQKSNRVKIKGLSSLERKFIHIESESLELNTESVGDNANKIIIITRKKENFILTDDRKEELRKIVINFNESPEEKLWFDITTEKEKNLLINSAKKLESILLVI